MPQALDTLTSECRNQGLRLFNVTFQSEIQTRCGPAFMKDSKSIFDTPTILLHIGASVFSRAPPAVERLRMLLVTSTTQPFPDCSALRSAAQHLAFLIESFSHKTNKNGKGI